MEPLTPDPCRSDHLPLTPPEPPSCDTAAELVARHQADALALLRRSLMAAHEPIIKQFGHIRVTIKPRVSGAYEVEIEGPSLGDGGLYLEASFTDERHGDARWAAETWAVEMGMRLKDIADWAEKFADEVSAEMKDQNRDYAGYESSRRWSWEHR